MPSPQVHLFVDNSNVLIEGRRFAYAKRYGGGARGTQFDQTYAIDWGKFLHLVKSKGNRLLATVPQLYGSTPPPDDSVWKEIRDEGFNVTLFERNIRGLEKGVDVEMSMDVVTRILTTAEPATLVIAAGDADFKGMAERALNKNWAVEIWFWGNAAQEMKSAATFVNLDPTFDYLRKNGGVAFPPNF